MKGGEANEVSLPSPLRSGSREMGGGEANEAEPTLLPAFRLKSHLNRWVFPAGMEYVVVSVGGSIFLPADEKGIGFIKGLADTIGGCVSQERKIGVTVGGGTIARRYMDWGRALGCDEFTLDELGIAITRVNALMFIMGFSGYNVAPNVMQDIPQATHMLQSYDIVVMGGTHPGHTTDAVAAMLAEKLRASRIVNATSVPGIFESDPKKNPHAKMFCRMRYNDLIRLLMDQERKAGANLPFDMLGIQLLKRSKIPLRVVDGKDLTNLKKAIRGEKFRGTEVVG